MKDIPVFRPFIDDREIDAVIATLKSRWIGMGPKTVEFEKDFSKYISSKNSIGVSSCTEAIQLALMVSNI